MRDRIPAVIAAALLASMPLLYRPMGPGADQAAAALLGPKTLAAAIAAVLIALSYFAFARRARSQPPTSVAVVVALSVFAMIASVTVIAASPADPATWRAVQHVLVFTALFLVIAALPRTHVEIVLAGAIIGGVAGAIAVIAQAYGWPPPGIRWQEGMALPAGTFPNRNLAAYPIGAGVILAARAAVAGAGADRWCRATVATIACAVCLLGLVTTCSRGAWLATALAASVAAVRHRAQLRRIVLGRGAAVIGAVIVFVAAATYGRPAPHSHEEQVQIAAHPTDLAARLDLVQHHESIGTRLALWRGAIAIARERPLRGWGPTGYLGAIEREVPGGASHTHAHNDVLHAAAVAGLPAAIALACFLAAVALAMRSRRGEARDGTIALVLLPLLLAPAVIEVMVFSPTLGPMSAILLGASLPGTRSPA